MTQSQMKPDQHWSLWSRFLGSQHWTFQRRGDRLALERLQASYSKPGHETSIETLLMPPHERPLMCKGLCFRDFTVDSLE